MVQEKRNNKNVPIFTSLVLARSDDRTSDGRPHYLICFRDSSTNEKKR